MFLSTKDVEHAVPLIFAVQIGNAKLIVPSFWGPRTISLPGLMSTTSCWISLPSTSIASELYQWYMDNGKA